MLFDEAPRLAALVARFRSAERRLAVALAEQLRRLGSTAPDVELTALLAVQGITDAERSVRHVLARLPSRRLFERILDAPGA